MAAHNYFSKNGIEIEYETAGDRKNPALLLVMGLGAQLTIWPDRLFHGLADKGFFVIQITDDRIRAAYRIKADVKATKDPQTKATSFSWEGKWDWKFLFDRKLAPLSK